MTQNVSISEKENVRKIQKLIIHLETVVSGVCYRQSDNKTVYHI